MTPGNVFVRSDGRRRCNPCQNERDRLARAAARVDRPSKKPAPPRLCEIDGCAKVHYAKGWCKMHWARWSKTGTTDDPVLFERQDCAVDGCARPSRRNGWCDLHAARAARHGDPEKVLVIQGNDAARFDLKTDRQGPIPTYAPHLGECWIWRSVIHPKWGYGRFSFGGKYVQAHRWSYQHFVGPIPKGLHIDHLCRVRACVRPDHLEPVTPAENNRRAALVKR